MDTLELTNFKAFLSPISIKFEQKNALIYGENGSGKSSIYDAIKLWFHTQKIYDKDLDKNLTDPNDIRNAQRDILDSYNHQKNKAVRFTMSLNGVLYSSTSSLTGYESFMIERSDLDITDNINIVNVLSKSLIGISNPQRFITENKLVLEELINATIQKDFHEPNIEISFQASGNDWFLKIKDIKRNIERVNELSKYFNEGKLHLIMLLILFSSIQLNGSIATKKNFDIR
ncbi:AAA family ATPase [Bacteroides uniformis]|uniref:AAA family ATPase n=1 Tax=Bacteroides uniformis TaxID=820 RepID=UPI0021661DE0|nr:AAA family ATPase [Bacteroides uniformis]MCS2412371.1 AAA family ATPase [Bacteroides uniformis]